MLYHFSAVRVTPFRFPTPRGVICRSLIRTSNINTMGSESPKYAEIKPEDAVALINSRDSLLVDVRYVCKVLP